LEDASLIQGCLKNDRKTQFLLYKKYYGFVSGICLRYLRSEPEARETTNDIFLKVFTKISLYQTDKGTFITWLRVLAVRSCLDKIKLSSFHDHIQSLNEESDSVSVPLIESFAVRDILVLLNQLPGKQSIIFNLFIVEGYTHEEIGCLLGISVGNSRWCLSDAKHRLRGMIVQSSDKI
jgi:RNA polymerase sigma factor (sigma-70 family)